MRQLIAFVLTLIAAGALLHYVDVGTAASAVASMPRVSLLAILALLLGNALARAFRWSFYLRSAGLEIRRRDAVSSLLAGMTLSWLPGGSLLSARLAQEHGHVRMRQATAALFVRLLADLIVVASLALVCDIVSIGPQGRVVIPVLGLIVAGILIAMSRSARFWNFVDRLLRRSRLTRNWLSKEEDVHARVRALMTVRVLSVGMLFSLVTTAMSIALLAVLVNGLTFRGMSPLEATAIHSTAETVNELIPIGVGFTIGDSSLAQMINGLGIGWTRVVYLLLTLRSINLLFKTTLGLAMLLACYRPLLWELVDLPRRRRATRRWAVQAARVARRNSGAD